MESPSRSDFVAEIHQSPALVMLVVTGGGTQALADLFAVPGASRTVLEALVPYSEGAMTGFLGRPAPQAVSAETAALLARKAREKALALAPEQEAALLGVACTAALVTDRPRKGEHRAHVAVCGGDAVEVRSVTLEKNTRTREGEERVVADMVLLALGRACGLDAARCDALMPRETVQIRML